MKRFEIHYIVGITLIVFGLTVLFLRSDLVGVASVLHSYGGIFGVALSDIVGISIVFGGCLYMLSLLVERLDQYWWHYFCASSLIGYVLPAYKYWLDKGTGVTFVAYSVVLLCYYALIAYHHRYEVLPEVLREFLPGGDDD